MHFVSKDKDPIKKISSLNYDKMKKFALDKEKKYIGTMKVDYNDTFIMTPEQYKVMLDVITDNYKYQPIAKSDHSSLHGYSTPAIHVKAPTAYELYKLKEKYKKSNGYLNAYDYYIMQESFKTAYHSPHAYYNGA